MIQILEKNKLENLSRHRCLQLLAVVSLLSHSSPLSGLGLGLTKFTSSMIKETRIGDTKIPFYQSNATQSTIS